MKRSDNWLLNTPRERRRRNPPARRLRGLAVLTAGLLLAVTACSNSSGKVADTSDAGVSGGAQGTAAGPGVTDSEIRFAMLGTKSNNPLGTCILDCFASGVNAYFAYRNSEGGVHGRKLVVAETVDDQLGKNQQEALKIVSANNTFGTFSAPLLATGFGAFAEAGVPLYALPANASDMVGKDSAFSSTGSFCIECTQTYWSYIAKLAGATRIAALGIGVAAPSKNCANGVVRSIETFGGKFGQKVVYMNDTLAYGLPNGAGPEVTAMKNAGVQLVIGCIDLNSMKTFSQEMERQGVGDVPMVHQNTYDQKFVAAGGDLFEGDYVLPRFRPFEADAGSSGLKTFSTWMKKAGSELTEYAMLGWIDADLAYQGIKAAGPSFTRASVIAATNRMTNYSADGLIDPIDWSRQHEPPTEADPVTHGYKQECITLVKVHNGRFEPVGDPKKPFICWPVTKERTWSEPTFTNFT
ncbi:ABC transporter substrate-binding protein [Frankia sp. CcI49]|uniref:ABC transporter substrate-binding protein n=1 Tax=Frankia sp. CcI49 TaxID=1745382 RepID=UPI000A05E194|nr:ABC transporter substrate-binding protein [Frankia sp. CcI49]